MLVNGTQARILLENILPKFLKITNLGTSQPYQGILASESEGNNTEFKNIFMMAKRFRIRSSQSNIQEFNVDFERVQASER